MNATIRTSRIAPLAVLVVAGLALAGCQPAERAGSEEGATSGGEAAGSLSSQEVIEMERGLWEALAQGDHAGFAEKIADDATLVGGQGLTEKQEMMAMLEGGTLEAYEVGDFQVMQPGSGVAVVTYRYSETFRPPQAEDPVNYAGWATSIWENRDGTWTAVFHQSTEEADGMEADGME